MLTSAKKEEIMMSTILIKKVLFFNFPELPKLFPQNFIFYGNYEKYILWQLRKIISNLVDCLVRQNFFP